MDQVRLVALVEQPGTGIRPSLSLFAEYCGPVVSCTLCLQQTQGVNHYPWIYLDWSQLWPCLVALTQGRCRYITSKSLP